MATAAQHRIFPLVTAGVLVVAAIIGGTTANQHQQALDEQATKIAKLEARASAARAETKDIQADTSLVDGARAGRVATDTQVISDLADRALSWDSDATYRQARSSTMRIYGLAENSVFMESFLPPAPRNTDSRGNVYPYIDAAGLNSHVGDITVRLLEVDGTAYSYMALVDVRADSSDKKGSAVNVATILATVDSSGKISDVSGYASTSQLRSSP